jgi:HAD superfamily hydrolase (TIGR01490 family)
VLITGVTGFVGEALLHRLLTQVPDCHISVLVRPKGSSPARERVVALLGKPIFAVVVEAAGDVESLVQNRLRIIEGDLGDVPPLPDDLDAVVHCAGDVSFDPAVDEAFTTNVVGVRGLLRRVEEHERQPHYVHVSTAYVAGRRRGVIPEERVGHNVDVEAELAWAMDQRTRIEGLSREPGFLEKTRRRAEKQHRQAGPISTAEAAEQRRREWVRDELVRTGRERARSLGWTDCYTFTKALGERVVEAHATTAPVTIVRPSIIESALQVPYPGWIEGFKMAEPIILAYGRGELPEFPAAADTTVDIVPVDHVVAALVAVLAKPPEVGRPRWFHVSSGARNPLTIHNLYDAVRRYFDQHPFEVGERGAARLPEWRFPGAQTVERLLVASERVHKAADYLVTKAPRSDRTREMSRSLVRQGRRLEFLRRYIDLYREYAEAELSFSDANTVALFDGLDPKDRAEFAFDTAVVDWDHYLIDVHCPAVTAPIRRFDEARRSRKDPAAPTPRSVGSDDAAIAVFDMDGTLLSSNVIETYLWLRLHELDTAGRFRELARVAARVPSLVRAERQERSGFLRAIYRDYEGADLAELETLADELLASHVLSRLSPDAVRRIRQHRSAGQRTVLVTGAIRPLTRSLEPLFDHIEAAELATDVHGRCTGHLVASPLVGESRAAWLRHWASANGADLTRSFAYADSHSDLPLLQAVGNPVAVRPDVQLQKHAKKNRWPIVDWASPESASRSLAPTRSRA